MCESEGMIYKMSRQKYYNINRIKKLNCEYNMILGERSNGKSYAIKHLCINDAIKDENCKFLYLRRWDIEIKNSMVNRYFLDYDVQKETNKEYDFIECYAGTIYLCNNVDGKTKRNKKIGYTLALTAEQHYTSGVFSDVKNIIFEEFISRDYYMPQEPTRLMQLISTIARRNIIKVWMIGNTISRLCPYFSEWSLVRIPKQEQGTIDIYKYRTDEKDENGNDIIVKIAVEYCQNSGNNSKMFFGQNSKMITSGAWQSESQPHLQKSIKFYRIDYEIVVQFQNYKFLCQLLSDKKTNDLLWYVMPKTTEIKKDTRVISDCVNQSVLYTSKIIPIADGEILPFKILKDGNIFFSDNLTGTDFKNVLKQIL